MELNSSNIAMAMLSRFCTFLDGFTWSDYKNAILLKTWAYI